MLAQRVIRKGLQQWPGLFGISDLSAESLQELARLRQIIYWGCDVLESSPPLLARLVATEDQTQATQQKVLQIAASLVVGSGHNDLLQALVRSAEQQQIQLRELEVESDPASGCLIAKLDRAWYLLGTPTQLLAAELSVGLSMQALLEQLQQEGFRTFLLAQRQPKRLLAAMALQRQYAESSRQTAGSLQELEVQQVLLSEEPISAVGQAAQSLGISLWRGAVVSREMSTLVQGLHADRPGASAMVRVGGYSKNRKRSLALHLPTTGATLQLSSFEQIPHILRAARQLERHSRRPLAWFTS
jgi:hypothetical protein